AASAGPQGRGDAVLLRLGSEVGGRTVAAGVAPGLREDLVVARRARAVGREVLAARLALDDRPRDRPRAAGTARRAGGLGGQLTLDGAQAALDAKAVRARHAQGLGARGLHADEGGAPAGDRGAH